MSPLFTPTLPSWIELSLVGESTIYPHLNCSYSLQFNFLSNSNLNSMHSSFTVTVWLCESSIQIPFTVYYGPTPRRWRIDLFVTMCLKCQNASNSFVQFPVAQWNVDWSLRSPGSPGWNISMQYSLTGANFLVNGCLCVSISLFCPCLIAVRWDQT